MTRPILLAIVLVAAACNGGDDIQPLDASADAFESICGMPGDVGNELGVGQFCVTLDDCSETVDAPICATLGDPMAYFCTKTCQPPLDAGVNPCGSNATCTCQGAQCGCTPNACLE